MAHIFQDTNSLLHEKSMYILVWFLLVGKKSEINDKKRGFWLFLDPKFLKI